MGWRDRFRDEVFFNCIRVDAVVDFDEVALDVPAKLALLFVFEALELLDEIEFELHAQPRRKLKDNVFVGVSSAIAPRLGNNAYSGGFLHPQLERERETVQPGLISKASNSMLLNSGLFNCSQGQDTQWYCGSASSFG